MKKIGVWMNFKDFWVVFYFKKFLIIDVIIKIICYFGVSIWICKNIFKFVISIC